ncbi:MAG: isoaspartyl peptidase/L-asparaginase family protein [Candidatus Hydrothermales bacterium]
MKNFGIIVHGGAGKHIDKIKAREGVKIACERGFEVLKNGGSAVDAVCAAIVEMENNPYFNAGFGAALTATGNVELDASIMEGKSLKFGAVAAISNFKNPILIARKIMEKTDHVLLVGKGAEEFALLEGFKKENLISEEKLKLYYEFLEKEKKEFKKEMSKTWEWIREKYGVFGGSTVGACAVDESGNIVAGTSTGGIFFKLDGRVGDTPCPGCGTYANSVCAASATGLGEAIMRVILAKFICDRVSEGLPPSEACLRGIEILEKYTGGKAGVIAISINLEFGYYTNTETMPVAFIRNGYDEVKIAGI